MGKFVIICKVCPKDGVVSFFRQQSVLLADSMKFLPGLSWQLLAKIFRAKNSGWSDLLKRETEVEGGLVPRSELCCPLTSAEFHFFSQILSNPLASQSLACWLDLLTNHPCTIPSWAGLGWAGLQACSPHPNRAFPLQAPPRQVVQKPSKRVLDPAKRMLSVVPPRKARVYPRC